MTEHRTVSRWAVVVVAAALSIPLVVAVLQMREPTWHPVLGGLLAIHEARKDARAGSA